MKLPARFNYIPIVGAMLYGLTTPIGIAAGLGVRTSYNPNSATASIVSGVLDSLSAGILIYTGIVEVSLPKFVSYLFRDFNVLRSDSSSPTNSSSIRI